MGPLIPAILAFAPAPADGQQPSLLVTLAPFILIFVIFYFLLIAPARKKQKRHAEVLEALKPGDKVVTQGGIHGTVVAVSKKLIQIRVADQVKIDVARHAIAGMQEDSE